MNSKFQTLIVAGLMAMGVSACSTTGTTQGSELLTSVNGGGSSTYGAVETSDSGNLTRASMMGSSGTSNTGSGAGYSTTTTTTTTERTTTTPYQMK